jgi:putative N6-adenine-specific DNA methylase
MCGSGTIPIEAGLIACNIPPGRLREFYGFQRWKDYDEDLYRKVRHDSDSMIVSPGVRISCSDISETVAEQARSNIARAGLAEFVTVGVADFGDLSAADDSGFLFLNPPYGERLQPDEIDRLYNMIGTTLKHNFPGTSAWLITSNKESLKRVGLKPARKYILFNGALECTLVNYEMYQGTKKTRQS